MKRRHFLKSLLALPLAAALPSASKAEERWNAIVADEDVWILIRPQGERRIYYYDLRGSPQKTDAFVAKMREQFKKRRLR